MEGSVTNFEIVLSKSSENGQRLFGGAKNPLEIARIIRCVFTFLPLHEIKNCRFVNKEWNYEALPFLRKLSQITLGSQYGNDVFKNAFRLSLTENLFHSLRFQTFREVPIVPWTESGLQEVVADWKTKLKELAVMWIDIMDDRFLPLRHFNMADVLNELTITELNAVSSPNTQLTFTVKSLLRVKTLRLNICDLIITEEDRLAANHVSLKFCRLIFQNNDAEKTLNSFIKLETAKVIIWNNNSGFGSEKIKLYADGKLEFDLLELKGVNILNWETSNWKVDILKLTEVDFAGITKMRVREMKVEYDEIAPRDIPETVEKLTFVHVEFTDILSPVSLPILKCLVVTESLSDVVNSFKSCPSLATLEIRPISFIESKWIPQNLKNIRILGRIALFWSEGEEVIVENLFMDEFPASYSNRNPTEKLKAKQIVWRMDTYPSTENEFKNILNFITKNEKKVALGEFNWKKVNFANCPLSQIVDKKSKYYLFENRKGKAISKEQFDKMIEF